MRYTPLTHNNEFTRAYMRGKSYVHPYLVVYVVKNRARRVMRAALCEVMPQDVGPYDVVLVARGATPRLKSTQLVPVMRKLLKKAGLIE